VSYRPYATPPQVPFAADKVIGIIILVFSGLGVIAGIAIALFMPMMFVDFPLRPGWSTTMPGPHLARPPGQVTIAPPNPGYIFQVVGGIIVLVSLVDVPPAIAMMSSKRWSFWFMLVVSALSGCSSHGAAFWQIAIFIYCLLRLTGSIGPKPAS